MARRQAAPENVEDLQGLVNESSLLEFLKLNSYSRGSHVFFTKGESIRVGNLTQLWNNLLTAEFDSKLALFEGSSPNNHSAFTVRLTLEWRDDEDSLVGEFNDRFKIAFIHSFQEAIRKVVEEEEDYESYMRCCLVEYDPNASREINIGRVDTCMRLIFPNLTIDTGLQRIIFDDAINRCRKKNIISLLSNVPLGCDISNCVTLLHNQHLQVLTNSCDPSYEYYREVSEDGMKTSNYFCAIEDVFSLSNLRYVDVEELRSGDDLQSYLPILMSRCYGIRVKIDYVEPVRALDIDSFGGEVDYSREMDNVSLSEHFLNMINPDRYYVHHYFMDIGRALHNIYEGSDEGRTVWFRRSRDVIDGVDPNSDLPLHLEELDRYSIEYRLFSTNDMGIDIRTLAWYAMIDNPDKYSDWHDMWVLNAIEKSVTDRTNEAIAEAFYRINWLTILTCPIPGDKSFHWHTYKNNIWIESSNRGVIIRQFTNDIIRRLELIRYRLKQRCDQLREQAELYDEDDEEGGGDTDNLQFYIKSLTSTIKSCGSSGFMSGVFTFAAAKLQVDNFFTYKNMNLNLTSMNNGVVEASYNMKSIIFREGKPQDYLTISTGKDLPIHYTWYSPEVRRYVKWIKQVYHTEELTRHIHKLFASGYIGGNLDKIMLFMLGSGNNAKTTIIKCMQNAWGDYMTMVPFTILTSHPPSPDKPNPLAFIMSGPRWAAMCEPSDEDTPLLAGSIKNETGNDDKISRYCHGNHMHRIIPTAVLIAALNKMLRMLGFGAAIRNRVKVITHDTTYHKNAPQDEATQKKIRTYPLDPTFINRVRDLGEAMLWVSYQYFIPYVTEGLEDPEEIIQATASYWEETDYYLMYVSERLDIVTTIIDMEEVPDEGVSVSVDKVYKDFQIWFSMRYPNQYPPNQSNFAHYMIEHIGRTIDRKWYGVTLVDSGEEEYNEYEE